MPGRDLSRQLWPLPGHLSPRLGETGLELVGRDVVAMLGSLPHRIRDGVGLARRELGVGQCAGDGVRVEYAPFIAEDADNGAGGGNGTAPPVRERPGRKDPQHGADGA